jgi:hypothetical protein
MMTLVFLNATAYAHAVYKPLSECHVVYAGLCSLYADSYGLYAGSYGLYTDLCGQYAAPCSPYSL